MNLEARKHRLSLPPTGRLIFLSRWLQAPLYLGLVVAQGVYVYRFAIQLIHLMGTAKAGTEEEIMLAVLGLIDVVMIANLLTMVIIGGYETFVSRLRLEGHPDQPHWLSHVNANILKVKLATALIGISSIHLLITFLDTEKRNLHAVQWQVIIHLTFVISAIALAGIEKLTNADSHAAADCRTPEKRKVDDSLKSCDDAI